MSTKIRRPKKYDDPRSEIAALTLKMIKSKGVSRVSLREIASKLEYTPTTIYHYFDCKEELIREIMDQQYRDFSKFLRRNTSGLNSRERLVVILKNYIQYAFENKEVFKLLFVEPLFNNLTSLNSNLMKESRTDNAFAFFVDSVAEACGKEGIKDDPRQIAEVLWSGTHGFAMLRLSLERESWFEWGEMRQARDRLISALLKGVFTS